MAEKYMETLSTNRALTKRIANLEAKLATAAAEGDER
jgi:BMFP domain-containing protein YqiC